MADEEEQSVAEEGEEAPAPAEGGIEVPEEPEPCKAGAPEWVVTFGDMMSLLLTFFILLLSFANLEVIKYKVLSGSIMQAFGVQEVTPVFTRPQADNPIAPEFSMQWQPQKVLDGMKKAEERQHARTPSGRVDIEVFEDYRGIVVSLGEEHMFEAGRADLRPAIWPFLDDVLDVARQYDAQIQVEAHTDAAPMRSAAFASNDHLSAARSVAVIEYLLGVDGDAAEGDRMAPGRFEAVPAGSTRPRTLNMTEAGRRKNRRVELVFYRPPQNYKRMGFAPAQGETPAP
ncbi:MAG: flagellar motor protein MotB [bacterium]